MEPLIDQVDKLKTMIDYISSKVDEDETAIIIDKLGLDNPHFSRNIDIKKYKRLADKMIMVRRVIRECDERYKNEQRKNI